MTLNQVEAHYFVTIVQCLARMGYTESDIQQQAHRVMDTWTFDGVLDTEALDAVIGQWNLTENGVTLPSN